MTVDPAILLLAADDVHGPEFGKATPMGLAIVLVLLAATFLLIRSMNRQIRKVPESFGNDDTAEDDTTEPGDEPGDEPRDTQDGAGDPGKDDDGPDGGRSAG